MAGSITGTQLNNFAIHDRSQASISIIRLTGGSRQIVGLTDEDDCIQIRQLVDSLTYTAGLYGGISANITTNFTGEVVVKLRLSSDDNAYFGLWHAQMKAGSIDPAQITISGANFRHAAFNCLPVKPAEPLPGSSEDPSMEWRMLASAVELFNSI